MGYSPSRMIRPASLMLTPLSFEAAVPRAAQVVAASTASGTWPLANVAMFCPVVLHAPFTAVKAFVCNGAAVSGNLDIGLYDEAGTRILSTGSTAQAGTNTLQAVDITDFTVPPGTYYLALALDNTTGTVLMWTPVDVYRSQTVGYMEMATAFALPASATFAVTARTTIPAVFGLSRRVLTA